MKLLIIRPALALVLTTVGALSAQAQSQSPYVGEALNYSRLQFGGPARTQGIAGANVALGADFGNLTSNPAGLGLYQKSEIHLAPGLGLGSGEARGNGGAQTADKNSFHIGSAGLVFTNRRPDGDDASNGWRGGSFGLGFTRQADFNQAFRYTEQAEDSFSFLQRLREPGGFSQREVGTAGYQGEIDNILAQYNNGPDGTYSTLDGLAYGIALTDLEKTKRSNLDSVTVYGQGPLAQAETVTTSGSVSQFDLGYGGSYQDRLYIGGAIGIVTSNRRQTRTFTAVDNDTESPLQDLVLRDEVETKGSGINARIGLIYRVTDVVRLGAAIQTPTFLRISETSSTTLTGNFAPDPQSPSPAQATASLAPPGEYTYNLTTPFRASGGAAITIGKMGFLTGDVEYVGYQQARLGSYDADAYEDENGIAADNQTIRQYYKSTVNLRLGAEGRFDIFRVRVGFANYGDPYRSSATSRAQQFYTAGAGLRQGSFFLDVAGVYGTYNQQYSPYTLVSGQQPIIDVTNKRFTTSVTAGLTF